MTNEKWNWMRPILIWLLGTFFAALLAMLLNWIPNPFESTISDGCNINNHNYNLAGAKIRLYHSPDKKGLAAAIEMTLQSCGAEVEVGNNNYKVKDANVRFYVEDDLSTANAIQRILNSVAGAHPGLQTRFVVNPRIDNSNVGRKNIFHAYF